MPAFDLRNAEWFKRQAGLEGDNHNGDFNPYPNDMLEKPPPWEIPNDEFRVITPEQYEEDTTLVRRGFTVEDISAQSDRYGRPIIHNIQQQSPAPWAQEGPQMHKGPYKAPQKDVADEMAKVPGVYMQNDSPIWNEGVTVDDVRKSHPPLAPLLERTIRDMQEAGQLPSNSKKRGITGIHSDEWTLNGRYDLYALDPDWDMIPEKWGGPPVDDPEAVGSTLRPDGTWSEPTWEPKEGTRALDFMRRLEFLKRSLEQPWPKGQIPSDIQDELDDLSRERQYDENGREIGRMMMLGATDRYGREITKRGSILPFVEYNDGTTSLGAPEWVNKPWEALKRLQGYQPGTGDEQAVRDAFDVSSAVTGGSAAFSRPHGSIGMGGRPTQWTKEQLDNLLKDRAAGMSYEELGKKYGISRSNAHETVQKHTTGPSDPLDEILHVDRFGRAVRESLNEGYGTSLQHRDYAKRLIESGASHEEVSRRMYDRFGREIPPDKVRQMDTWSQGPLNERYMRDRTDRTPFLPEE